MRVRCRYGGIPPILLVLRVNVSVMMSERLFLWSQEDNLILTNDEDGVLLAEIVIKCSDED